MQVKKIAHRNTLTKAINRVVEKGWLQWDAKTDTFKMHNVIQEVLRFKLDPQAEHCRDLVQEMYSRIGYQHIEVTSKNNLIVKHLTQYINGDSIDFSELLDEYANVLQRLYAHEESIQIQTRALEMKERVLPENDLKLADSYNSLALSYKDLQQLDKALEFQLKDLAITQFHSKEEDYNLAITYHNLSLIYRKTKDLDQATYYQNEAIRIAKKIKDPDLDIVVYNCKGHLEYLQKNFKAALKYYQQSLAIRENNKADQLWISEAHYNLGTAYIEVSDFEKAKTHLDIAFDIEKDLVADKSSFGFIQHGYGLLYFELKDLPKSLGYFQKSYAILRQNFSEEHYEVARAKGWIERIEKELK